MAFCGNCGNQFHDNLNLCPKCGTVTIGARTASNTDQQDAEANKVMGVLAYIGLLCLVPIFGAKQSRFARYHANQGLVLLVVEYVYGILLSITNTILYSISYMLGLLIGGLMGLISVVFLVFAIIGIVNAVNGRMKPLPLIGGINLLK